MLHVRQITVRETRVELDLLGHDFETFAQLLEVAGRGGAERIEEDVGE